jgi:hypothetical protein
MFNKFIISVIVFFCLLTTGFSQLSVYPALPGNRNASAIYSVRLGEADQTGTLLGELQQGFTYQLLRSEAPGVNNTDMLSDNHWITFSFSPTETASSVQIEVSKKTGSIAKVEFRPSTNVKSYSISGGKLMVNMESDKIVTAIINDDIKQPLFLFCDPKETNVPDTTATDVFIVKGTTRETPLRINQIPAGKKKIYFGPGIHYAYNTADPISSNGGGIVLTTNTGSRLNNNAINQVYIAGGAFVVGAIRAPKVSNLTVNGRGILAGQVEGIPYCEQGNDYLSDRIYNSAIVMADYNSKTNRNQLVDGITVMLPLKYCIQVGAYATVRNTKSFAFHQTTDGVGAEANAKIYNNFFKVNDDVVKVYNDNMDIRNTHIWHQNNGACFQLGWNESQGKNSVIKHTFLIRDDAAESHMNESHWDNHSFINWHSTGYTSVKPVHDGHVFDSINSVGMPPVKVWRFMAINLNGKYPAGKLGGILKNLQVKNVNLGPEKLDSYIGATINGSTAEVHFTNAKLNGVCVNKTNIIQDGQVTVTPTTNVCFNPTTPPPAPTEFKVIAKTYKSIILGWNDNSEIEEYFKLERSMNGVDGWSELTRAINNSYTDANLLPETDYYYRLMAINSIGSSDTVSLSVRTNAAPVTVPAAPDNISAVAESDKVISLTWNDNATDEDEYIVQKRMGDEWQVVTTLQAGSQKATIKGLNPQTEYTFRVVASNLVGLSQPSNSATATTKTGFNSGILSNGSFEEGPLLTEEGSWVLQSGYVSQSDEKAKTGEFSLKFQNPGGNYLEPEFNLKPLFACYGAGSYNVTMSVWVPASNTGKVELYFTPQNIYFQPGTVKDQWVTINKTVNYTANGEIKLKAKTYNGPSGAYFYVDDIAVTTTNTNTCNANFIGQKTSHNIKLFPNPASEGLFIELTDFKEFFEVYLYSPDGKKVLNEKSYHSRFFIGNAEKKFSGLYFITVIYNGNVLRDKILFI